jgi:hypothetical protein
MCAVSCGSQRSQVIVVVGRLATWRVDVDHPRLRILSALLRLFYNRNPDVVTATNTTHVKTQNKLDAVFCQ